jgi:hypothetical protein
VRADTEVECYALPAAALAGLSELDAALRVVLLRNLLEIVSARMRTTGHHLAALID